MIDKVQSNQDECELACLKIEDCTFYQYHYITSPPLLAATNCLYVKNTTSLISGSDVVPTKKIQGTDDVYSCWVRTEQEIMKEEEVIKEDGAE